MRRLPYSYAPMSSDSSPREIAGTPPPVPPSRDDGAPGFAGHVLVWVRTGTARVLMDDASEFLLGAGEGVWLPAGGPAYRQIATDPGTVAFPLWTFERVGIDLAEPRPFVVPDAWQDWLIQHYGLLVTPLSGRGRPEASLADLLAPSLAHPATENAASPVVLDPLAMPRARPARIVAEQLLRDPSLDLTVAQWAERVLCSPRTLRRDFLSTTGLSFEQWRLTSRLAAAVDLLAAGRSADDVAIRAGFGSLNGFTRAFKARFGATPHAFGRELSARGADGAVARGATAAAVQANDLARMMRGGETSVTAPRLLPASRTPLHTNDSHVLTWQYRGTGHIGIGDRRYPQGERVATWMPAGVEHAGIMEEGAILLPLGDVGPADLTLTEPVHVQFSPAWDDYLMFCSISARSNLRPVDYDPTHVLGLFREQVAAQRALTLPMPRDPRAHAAAADYLRTVGTSREPTAFDLPADAHAAFVGETGMSFARWRYAARMRIARDLLAGGAKPSAVARRVGYAHLPNFSTAFHRFHGVSPRAYQLAHEPPAR